MCEDKSVKLIGVIFIIMLSAQFMLQIGLKKDLNYISNRVYDMQTILQYKERSEMFNTSNRERTEANGIYFEPNYYCVWTKGRTEEEINRTECHELCHSFVYMQREHFCGGD